MLRMNEQYCQIWLSAIPGLGSRRCIRLTGNAPGGKAAGIYAMTEKELTETAIKAENSEEQGIKTAELIIRGRNTARERADTTLAAMKKSGMGYVCIEDKEYPDRLVHYKGNILLVSINYSKTIRPDDKNYKHHTCLIEEA